MSYRSMQMLIQCLQWLFSIQQLQFLTWKFQVIIIFFDFSQLTVTIVLIKKDGQKMIKQIFRLYNYHWRYFELQLHKRYLEKNVSFHLILIAIVLKVILPYYMCQSKYWLYSFQFDHKCKPKPNFSSSTFSLQFTTHR